MTPPVPARITIEFHQVHGQATWTTSTRVEGDAANGRPVFATTAAEPRHEEMTPEAYDACDCTCHDGWCGRDHEND